MKKKNLLLAAMGIALAGCSDDLTGITAGPTTTEEAPEAIMFGNITDHMTRATTGEPAANLLGKKIYFYGEKVTGTGNNATHTPIFDNYSLEYDGEAGSTATNVAGWEYVGKTSKKKASQDAKYWDYNSNEYNFVAVSANALPEDGDLINGAATADDIKINVPSASSVDGLYVADRITRTPTEYKQTVQFNFRRLGARMRIGFYETVPGYAIKNLIFYYVGAASGSKTLGVGGAFPVSGKYNVSFDDNNKATVKFNGGSNKMEWSSTFGELDYTSAKSKANVKGKDYIDENGAATDQEVKKFLGTNATEATYAKGSYTIDGAENTTSDYKPILPNENNSLKMQLRVDYTLVALDGSGDEINVRDAYVSVPVEYLKWKPNYAYTYLFKISDKSNGYTSKGSGDIDDTTGGRKPDPDNGGGDKDPSDIDKDGHDDPPYVPDPDYKDPETGEDVPPYIPDPDDPTGKDSIPNPDVPLIPNPVYPGNDPDDSDGPKAPDGDQGDPSNPVPTPQVPVDPSNPDGPKKDDPDNPAGLYPITFDACVEEVTENTQETVTTVATPSITATQEGQAVTDNNEFVTSLPIILTVQDGVTASKWEYKYEGTTAITEKSAEQKYGESASAWTSLSTEAKATLTPNDGAGYYIVRVTTSTGAKGYKVLKVK